MSDVAIVSAARTASGASGARILATLCVGGGMGVSLCVGGP